MGWFREKTAGRGRTAPLQMPDQLAQEAADQYGNRDFAGALQTYGRAIDKIHTMCVMASPGSRIRSPGPQDQPILDGFNSSLGAALALNPRLDVATEVERATAYLRQVAMESPGEAPRYFDAIERFESTYRAGAK
ncbi:hypothetical protein [Blastococcus sp. CT_GayMR16]|uniref:hypothetical protein n=1 Tax=Blastococcus sp. CT_GayMR16 TaxID=2559607 RepID=UPI0010741AE0|nr:hypothetical protein [Blastococcus sp. CT_GayMR16]TFV91149.1 hypothetical protein E4P38_00625 [Blastococcus sp. CT_GayMR16]